MAEKKGLLVDPETGDLAVIGGTLTVGKTKAQNQAFILRAGKGEFKEYPTLGVGIADILGDDDLTGWKREIALQMEADGMKVNRVSINVNDNTVAIDADYNE